MCCDVQSGPKPDAVLEMLKRTTLALHAISLLNGDVGPRARESARVLAFEATALIGRVEAKK